MKYLLVTCFAMFLTGSLANAEGKHTLATVDKLPAGVPEKIAGELQATGQQVKGEKGVVATFWPAKQLPIKAGFKPGFSVKYPLSVGQFVGILQVPKDAACKDFRGQELKAGLYSVRYGQQPTDGNHIGTSETADFLLALPIKTEKSTAKIDDTDALNEKSAEAAGSPHPAIFSLVPDAKAGKPSLSHNEDRDYWILNITIPAKAGDKDAKLPLSVILVGESEV